jgi:2-oxoglutarate ferredoxin oxidoreductase subunit gamma
VPSATGADRDRALEFRFSGSGGQGIILAATVLAEVACAGDFEVVQTQNYGPEARGGASAAEVIVSRAPIDYPEVRRPDLTLCLSQEAFAKYAAATRPDGVVLYDSGLVDPGEHGVAARLVGLPFTATARELAGTPQAANMVALGALEGLLALVGYDALVEGVRSRVPRRHLDGNLQAVRAGYDAAQVADASAGVPAGASA